MTGAKAVRPHWTRRRKRELEARSTVVVVSRWIVRAYGRQVGIFKQEADAYRVADDYRWLGVTASVIPTSLKVAA